MIEPFSEWITFFNITTKNLQLEQEFRSKNWKSWIAQIDIKLCEECRKMHGKIFPIRKLVLPLHLYCRCVVVPLQAVASGYATLEGSAGADYWLKNYQRLPDKYITKEDALDSGWMPGKGNFNDIFPGKTIGGSVYFNRNGHLPSSAGRIWYEADINYSGGFRGADRILYSNDGLIFVTYDHCHIGKSNSAQLLGVALRQAHISRNPSPGLVFHSDRGKPYCSKAFFTKLEQYGMVQSLSRTGKPHDNAVMESFFSSMKRESLYRREYPSESAFRQSVFQYIEFYNTKRPHTYLKHKTPTQFEQAYYEKYPVSRQGSDC